MYRQISWAILLMFCSLSGCALGLSVPDPLPYTQRCDNFIRPGSDVSETALYFMTSRLPDCRGGRLDFADFRHAQTYFGISELPPGAVNGWHRHRSALLHRDDWERSLQQSLWANGNTGRLLVYVHGYYNDFDDALERAGILQRLHYAGVPAIAVSWPSRNRRQSYTYDEDSISWAQDYLDDLLLQLVAMDSAVEITLVSHSMGGRALLRALDRLDLEAPLTARKVRRIVLASPDVDRNQVMRTGGALDRLLRKPGREVLIYVSRRDLANRASRAVHGYSRLGSSDCSYDVAFENRALGTAGDCYLVPARPGLAIVETSTAGDSDFFGHSDFAESCIVRADLAAFLRGEVIDWREEVRRPGQDLVGYRIDPGRVGDAQCRRR